MMIQYTIAHNVINVICISKQKYALHILYIYMYTHMYVYDTYVHMHMYLKTSRSLLSSVPGLWLSKTRWKVDKSFRKLLAHTSSKEKNIFLKRVTINSWYKLPTKKQSQRVKEPAAVRSRKTYRYIFNCLQTFTKWKEKQRKEQIYKWKLVNNFQFTTYDLCGKNFSK